MDPKHETAKKWVRAARRTLQANPEFTQFDRQEKMLRSQIETIQGQLEDLLSERAKLGHRLVGSRALGAVDFCAWYETSLPNIYPTDEDLKLLGITR